MSNTLPEEMDPFAGVVFPEVMELRIASVYLDMSETRLRTLLREGRIKATKDEETGKWQIKKADLDTYNATKGTRTSAGPRKQQGEGKAWLVKVPYAKFQAVKDALAILGIELLPRYNYDKQRAYQSKRKAAKAAEKAEVVKAQKASKPAQS